MITVFRKSSVQVQLLQCIKIKRKGKKKMKV